MSRYVICILLMIIVKSLFPSPVAIFVCEEYPPYEYMDGIIPKGSDIDVINKVCMNANIYYTVEFYPWLRCLKMISDGNADGIFALLKTDERLKLYKFTDYPISLDRRIIVTKKDNKLIVNSLIDLNKIKVGVVYGYNYDRNFDMYQVSNKVYYSSSKILVDKFANREVEVIAINEYVFNHYIKSKKGIKYKIQNYVITTDPLYIAFSKNSLFFDSFNKSLNKLVESGVIKNFKAVKNKED